MVLNTTLTERLVLEGLAREMVRTIQNLRKEADFVITDHIKVYYKGNLDIDKMLTLYKEYVMGEVLAEDIIFEDINAKDYDLNGHLCKIKVEKI